MKNRFLFYLFLSFLLITLSNCATNHQSSPSLSVVRTSTETFGDDYVQNLCIVLSETAVPDFKTCAMEIVDHCIHNTFSDIQFSYDVIGYPVKLHGTVYLNNDDFITGNILFKFSYDIYVPSESISGSYNVVQNPEYYQLTIYESGNSL